MGCEPAEGKNGTNAVYSPVALAARLSCWRLYRFDIAATAVAQQLEPDVPVAFTAFHPDFKMRDRLPTPPETLVRARRIAMDDGIRYVHTGNLHDPARYSTRCHHCGTVGIEPDWWPPDAWRPAGYGLSALRHALPGGAGRTPGASGPRLLPVRIVHQ